MTIKTAANELYDKNGDAYDATEGFTVTGVLIGGQKAVGFDFIPNGTEAWTIYDNIQKSQTSTTLTANTEGSAPNYTLALETAVNTKGLAAAYNTIPDLRTPQLELGLSVDLTWQPGVQFDLDL